MRCYYPYSNYCWSFFYYVSLGSLENSIFCRRWSTFFYFIDLLYYIVQYYHRIFSMVLFYTNLFLSRCILFLVVDVIHNSQLILISIFIFVSYYFTSSYSIVYMNRIVLWLSDDLRIISISIVLRTLSFWIYDDFHFRTYLHSA